MQRAVRKGRPVRGNSGVPSLEPKPSRGGGRGAQAHRDGEVVAKVSPDAPAADPGRAAPATRRRVPVQVQPRGVEDGEGPAVPQQQRQEEQQAALGWKEAAGGGGRQGCVMRARHRRAEPSHQNLWEGPGVSHSHLLPPDTRPSEKQAVANSAESQLCTCSEALRLGNAVEKRLQPTSAERKAPLHGHAAQPLASPAATSPSRDAMRGLESRVVA